MKRTATIGLAGIMLLCLFDISLAQDRFALSVSCSIPSVPGLNAPLIQEKNQLVDIKQLQTAQNEVKYEKNGQEVKIIQEEKTRINLAKNDKEETVTTLYSR